MIANAEESGETALSLTSQKAVQTSTYPNAFLMTNTISALHSWAVVEQRLLLLCLCQANVI